jgi:hypothetical protein
MGKEVLVIASTREVMFRRWGLAILSLSQLRQFFQILTYGSRSADLSLVIKTF